MSKKGRFCSNCGKKKHKCDCNDGGKFITSTIIGAATGSALLGGLLGGDIVGGVVGDILDGDLFD